MTTIAEAKKMLEEQKPLYDAIKAGKINVIKSKDPLGLYQGGMDMFVRGYERMRKAVEESAIMIWKDIP